MEMICRVIIRGRVQGVGFRAWAEITALELGIEGWVRNRGDGSVEAVLAGSEEAVLTMVESCHVDQTEAGERDLELRRPGELFSVLASG
jgi:acylphosphatase